jgi:L-seryl-tRNA(Ser) seleniumtransferase
VDALLASGPFQALLADHPRERVLAHLRRSLDDARRRIGEGGDVGDVTSEAGWAGAVAAGLEADRVPSLRPVINATGVVLHTNLGRAPLSRAARDAMAAVARGYSNLEFDLESGRRGSRYHHCAGLFAELTGAEDALVVNNAAAALVLALNTVALGRGVAVSRGELVEIGGGFRIPEILARSGARLVEVGSTNRTRPSDYAAALDEGDVGALLKVHRSNFRMSGFTEEATLEELADLARSHAVPLLFDLGSGLFADPGEVGLPPEPRALEAVAAGADLVVVSGDKLLGGPQAGIIVGREPLVAALRTNPLCRALRVDKVTLAGLEATARAYRDTDTALQEIPVLRMLSRSEEEVWAHAEALARRIRSETDLEAAVEAVQGAVGGGTYPEVALPSWAVVLAGPPGAAALARELRDGDPPVVGRVEDDRLILDLRTVDPEEEDTLVRRLAEAGKPRP